MELTRIMLHGGYASLGIDGKTYLPDEFGAFEVPSNLAAELIRIHGGSVDKGLAHHREMVVAAERELAAAKNNIELKTKQLADAKSMLQKYVEQQEAKRAEAAKATEGEPKVDETKNPPQGNKQQQPQQQGRR